jgi:hypothetical protein
MYNHIHIRKVKEVETGGRPTPMDEPVRFRSLPDNVGFEIHGENLISKKEKEQSKITFLVYCEDGRRSIPMGKRR